MSEKKIKSLEDKIIKHCQGNPGAQYCIFPFKKDGRILQLKVINPFYTEKENEVAVSEAINRLARIDVSE